MRGSPAGARTSDALENPDAACAGCHRAIYERYQQTPMANSSGTAAAGFLPANFVHPRSGVHYRITKEDGQVWLHFERQSSTAERSLNGERRLLYFVGSGDRGRTYLFDEDGYWFESPINWYAKKRVWDMAPNMLLATEMPMTMEVDPGCLHCHASGVAEPLKDARNHFAGRPFAAGGVTCASCHGDGRAHVASGGKTPMLDLTKLAGVRRDSICLNCHLEGQAMVGRRGKTLAGFRPGDNLFHYALYFVFKSDEPTGGRASSQWEALLRSRCKQASGDKMTCTTCHDPHGDPPPGERVAFFRQKCLQCHNTPGFAAQHHPENPDCTACHMARLPSSDIAHSQITDHWIRIDPHPEQPVRSATEGALAAVGGMRADDRDLGLAYAQMAERGDEAAGKRAMKLLRRAEKQEAGAAKDSELHTQIGFLDQELGDEAGAAREYRAALAANADDATAAGDLALIEVRRRQTPRAVARLQRIFAGDPALVQAGMNLAVLECGQGKRRDTLATLDRLLAFSPDNQQAKSFEMRVMLGTTVCRENVR
ncbi:MAG TPA: multiheme c-type cytochrome [Terracidiphilus sp.]|nr:multiheme c-type cytochrome [Terracidiphilus sp.]